MILPRRYEAQQNPREFAAKISSVTVRATERGVREGSIMSPNQIANQVNLKVSTAHIADACLKEKVEFFVSPRGLKPVVAVTAPGALMGRVVPVRHYGSVDVFLEVIENTPEVKDAILVIDNQGREDEACIGDLIVLEAKNAGFAAILVWGLHRDTWDVKQIGLPVFSYGAYPSGPLRLDARHDDAFKSAHFGAAKLTSEFSAFVDDDGAVFVETKNVERILPVANAVREREVKQASIANSGKSLRQQFSFAEFLTKRQQDPNVSFRTHLRDVMSSIEE